MSAPGSDPSAPAQTNLWPPATSTGIGSMPGTDVNWAATVAFDVPSMPFVPELPDRGPGAGLVGRGIGHQSANADTNLEAAPSPNVTTGVGPTDDATTTAAPAGKTRPARERV